MMTFYSVKTCINIINGLNEKHPFKEKFWTERIKVKVSGSITVLDYSEHPWKMFSESLFLCSFSLQSLLSNYFNNAYCYKSLVWTSRWSHRPAAKRPKSASHWKQEQKESPGQAGKTNSEPEQQKAEWQRRCGRMLILSRCKEACADTQRHTIERHTAHTHSSTAHSLRYTASSRALNTLSSAPRSSVQSDQRSC